MPAPRLRLFSGFGVSLPIFLRLDPTHSPPPAKRGVGRRRRASRRPRGDRNGEKYLGCCGEKLFRTFCLQPEGPSMW
ncbi:hypothetical protein Q5P01_002150 [Channa striata]|uniref:Uncharacterized protein n=1 Tax=Channa striata TaxID=64152 RepID=A0AA88NPJ8_CHASR|nr:hypothetical protein Q5P01_002150 [Channa striata]